MSTYCGKNCDACTYREQLSCTGCQSGPGRVVSGDCKLARCCRDKGHETCETCVIKHCCGTWLDKGNIPKQRIERMQEEKEEQELIAHRAPILGKWLWILFWLVVPQGIANFITSDSIVSLLPAVEKPAQIILVLCMILRVAVLLWVSKEQSSYRTAGLFGMANITLNMAVLFFEIKDYYFLYMWAVAQLIIWFLSEYNEYVAHADTVMIVNAGISQQWDNYWKLNKYSCIGLIVSMFLIFLMPSIGALAILVFSLCILVAAIKKLICLYRTAKAFRAKAGE